MDASTDNEVFSWMRFIISSRTVLISWVETIAESMKTAVPISSMTLPLSRTGPVNVRVVCGPIIPSSVATNVSPISMM